MLLKAIKKKKENKGTPKASVFLFAVIPKGGGGPMPL
jgi:hypothetical protein